MSHGGPYLLRTYAGKPEKLASAVTALLAGQRGGRLLHGRRRQERPGLGPGQGGRA